MLENKHFSAKHKTGDSIKLRTDSGVIHDSCEANIGSLQGNCRSISAILCDGALDGEKWHVINRVHAQTGTFYDHIAVKGAVSEAQALRLCQKYFNPFENAVTKSVVAVGDNGLKLFLDSKNTPTNTNFFLPQDAQILDSMVTQKPVEWTDEKLSSHHGTMSHLMLDMATYDLSGELLEKVTPKDVVSMLVDDQCQFMMYDAMILKYRQLDLAMKKIADALKQSDTEEFFVKEVTPIEPFKRQGVVNVGAIFEMSDTQTITVLFNNPDTTPAKLTSTDVITSWKWILNKRDVTAVLQPRAVDAKKYPMIANRMYQLLAKNHARFKRAQAVRNKDEALLAELIGQLEADQLEARMIEQQIADIQTKIDDIGVKKQQQSALESGNEKPLDGGVAVLEDGEKMSEAVADTNAEHDTQLKDAFNALHAADQAFVKAMGGRGFNEFILRNGGQIESRVAAYQESEKHAFESSSDAIGEFLRATKKYKNVDAMLEALGADNGDKDLALDAQLQGAIAKVQRIVDELIADYGFSYATDVKSTELDKTLISENGYNLSIVIDEDDSEIILDSGKLIVDRIDTTESVEYIVKAIAQADFERNLGFIFEDTDLVEDKDSPYFGKNAEYAFTIKQLDEAVKSLGLDIVYDDFDKTEAVGQGLFDSLESSNAKLIYGITAQIGKDGEVLARARVDFDGNLDLLSGATGSTVLKSLKFDLAVKKNIVAALGGDAVKTTPKTTPKTTADEPTAVEDTAAATVFEPTITRYNIKSTNPRARKPVGSVKLTSREDGMSDVLFVMDGVGGEYVGTIEDVQKWVAMRMQGLGSAAAGEETTFSDVKPRLTLVEGEDLLGVNATPSQSVQATPPAEESAVNNADIKMTGSAAQRLPFLASALVSLGEGWVKDGDTAIKNIQFKNGITDVFRLILSDNGRDFIIVDNDNRVVAVQYDDFKTENGVNNAAININNRINEQVAYLNELYSGGAKSHQGESAVNENEKFLNDVIAGAVDLGADATGERLEQIGEDLDPALEDLFEQAAEVYAQFAINNAQSA